MASIFKEDDLAGYIDMIKGVMKNEIRICKGQYCKTGFD